MTPSQRLDWKFFSNLVFRLPTAGRISDVRTFAHEICELERLHEHDASEAVRIRKHDVGEPPSLDFLATRPKISTILMEDSAIASRELPGVAGVFVEYGFSMEKWDPFLRTIQLLPHLRVLDLGGGFVGANVDFGTLSISAPLSGLRTTLPHHASSAAGLRGLTGLKKLHIDATTETSIEPVNELDQLEYMFLSGGRDWEALSGSRSLKKLGLDQTSKADNLINIDLPALEELYFCGSVVDSLAGISSMANLRSLSLSVGAPTGVEDLGSLPSLSSLRIDGITDRDFYDKLDASAVSTLEIELRTEPSFVIDNLEFLGRMDRIENLTLNATTNESALEKLTNAPNLKKLKLFGRHRALADVIRQKIPACTIEVQEPV